MHNPVFLSLFYATLLVAFSPHHSAKSSILQTLYMLFPGSSGLRIASPSCKYVTLLKQRRGFRSTNSLFLNRYLFDPCELNDFHTNLQQQQTIASSAFVKVPTVTLPATDYRAVHAAKILGVHNGDTIRAGIVIDQQLPVPIDASYSRDQVEHQHHPAAGLITDHGVITWIPEGKIKKPQPTKNGEPPGSLLIRLEKFSSHISIRLFLVTTIFRRRWIHK